VLTLISSLAKKVALLTIYRSSPYLCTR